MKLDSFKCDACGKLREKDGNRWWSISVELPQLKMEHFSDSHRDEKYFHLCGEDCALQMIQRWLATGNFSAPSQRPISKPEGA